MHERINVYWLSAFCRRLAEQWPLYALKTCKLQHVSTPFHIPRFPEANLCDYENSLLADGKILREVDAYRVRDLSI